MANQQVTQGTLNRLRASVVLAQNPALNITSPYMGSNFVKVELPGPYAELLPTGTGTVISDQPYTIGTITVDILRTQALSAAWVAQAQSQSSIGDITVYPDAASFPPITLQNCGIDHIDPHAYDGRDPVVQVVIRGDFFANSDMWSVV